MVLVYEQKEIPLEKQAGNMSKMIAEGPPSFLAEQNTPHLDLETRDGNCPGTYPATTRTSRRPIYRISPA
jgi:hypothetical protein